MSDLDSSVLEEDDDDVDMSSNEDAVADRIAIESSDMRKAPYTIVDRLELADKQTSAMTDAAELLGVTQEEGSVLLREYGWDLARLQESWFAHEQKVRKKCGLATSMPSECLSIPSSAGVCPICFQSFPGLPSLDCGHGCCQNCWQAYLSHSVDEGKASVRARCPLYKCGRSVPSEFYLRFLDQARHTKYLEWRIRAYVDDNPSMKWCTSPAGCLLACEHHGGDACDVHCLCTFVWCWACGDEAHRPADCELVNRWNIKNSAESENITWIKANTKKCPKCHKPIEKNQGCNHMVCSKNGGCGHEFCWLCLGEWSKHGTSTGGYYQCNIYDKQTKEGAHTEEELDQRKAQHSLEKYMFYFERFMNHDRGMKLTVREEKDIDGKVQILHDRHSFEIIELQFLYDALKQVCACRRVLKWTYVYGYYLETAGAEKNLFEHLQKNLEEKTDLLHEMLEKDLEAKFFANDTPFPPQDPEMHTMFMEFRSHVTNFTNVTQKFREQILSGLSVGESLTASRAEGSRSS